MGTANTDRVISEFLYVFEKAQRNFEIAHSAKIEGRSGDGPEDDDSDQSLDDLFEEVGDLLEELGSLLTELMRGAFGGLKLSGKETTLLLAIAESMNELTVAHMKQRKTRRMFGGMLLTVIGVFSEHQ